MVKFRGKKVSNPVDAKVRALTAQYAASIAPRQVEINNLVDFLQTDREFGRRTKQQMTVIANKALSLLKNQRQDESDSSSGEESDEDVKIIDAKDANMMNSSISKMYADRTAEALKAMDIDPTNAANAMIGLPGAPNGKAASKNAEAKLKRAADENAAAAAQKKRKTNPAKSITEGGIAPTEAPKYGFEILGGIDKVVEEIKVQIERPILYPQIFDELGVQPSHGFLLHGPPGCGKTVLANCIAGDLARKLGDTKLTFFRIAAPELVSGMSGESESNIRILFDAAKSMEPCVIFIDEIDVICGKRDNAQREMERRIVAQLLTCFDDLQDPSDNKTKRLVIIGATNRLDALDPSLRRSGRFDREIPLGVPDEAARAKILKVLAQKVKMTPDVDFDVIAHKTPGFVASDLTTLISEASSTAVSRIITSLEVDFGEEVRNDLMGVLTPDRLATVAVSMDDFVGASKKVQPTAKREGFATIPNVSWDDVGALEEIRKELAMFITEPIKHPKRYKQLGLDAPAGVLLYGPPGCGKTLLAKAIANDVSASFISVKGPELLNKFVGESERAVRKVFERAKMSAPCIIFFDELDALVPKRDDDGNSATKRVVNQLLTELDGLEERKGVFIIAATNRPDIIDSAMLRPQRLDKLLFVPLPDHKSRVSILKTLAKKTRLTNSVDLEHVAKHCERFSGADLSALVREASVIALAKKVQRSMTDNSEMDDEEEIFVDEMDFDDALKKVGPSVSPDDEIKYLALRSQLDRVTSHRG